MSQKFCDICQSLLISTTENELRFSCVPCNQFYIATDADTLIYEEIKKENTLHYKLIENIAHDPANPKVKVKCPVCKYMYARQIRINTDIKTQLVNSCIAPNCHHTWQV